ncbi:hypothetical protein ABI59_09005 [Acidobacteria bacterium Mor1]|nr:hypothetical protein ABI59_09005 [Acidobacteria bacterium Mor1]
MDSAPESYAKRVAALTPAEKVRQAEALRLWSREYLKRTILRETPGISGEELRWELALRIYGSDPKFRAWAEERRNRAAR